MKFLALIFLTYSLSGKCQSIDTKDCFTDFKARIGTERYDTVISLKIRSTCVDSLPEEIFAMINLKSISIDWIYNRLNYLSPRIGSLSNLQAISLIKCGLDTLPEEIGYLKKLKSLQIINSLSYLPKEIGMLTNLEYLDLQLNKLTTLPEEIKNLKKLKTLRLEGNNFSEEEKNRIKKLLPNCAITFWK